MFSSCPQATFFFFCTLKIECQCKEIIDAKKKIEKRKPHKDEEKKILPFKIWKVLYLLGKLLCNLSLYNQLKMHYKKIPNFL
jgi:hypothetical protein